MEEEETKSLQEVREEPAQSEPSQYAKALKITRIRNRRYIRMPNFRKS